jgi:hypothetical protein
MTPALCYVCTVRGLLEYVRACAHNTSVTT